MVSDPHPCGCSGLAELAKRILTSTETGHLTLSDDDLARLNTLCGQHGKGQPAMVRVIRSGSAVTVPADQLAAELANSEDRVTKVELL